MDQTFDLASLDMATPSEAGQKLELRHPSGQMFRLPDGEPLHILLAGRYSARAREALQRLARQSTEMREAGQKVTPEIFEEQDTEYLCACTIGWNIPTLDGQPFTVAPANIRRLWTDMRFRWIRVIALDFIGKDAVFLPAPG